MARKQSPIDKIRAEYNRAKRTHHDTQRQRSRNDGLSARIRRRTNWQGRFRHGRYWIDEANGAELARPEVVNGIAAFYRNAAKTTLENRNPAACAAQIEEWNEAFERAAIEQHDDIH